MISGLANLDSQLRVKFYNNETGGFEFESEFIPGPRGNPVSEHANGVLPRQILHRRNNYFSIVGHFQWCIFPLEYYTTFPVGGVDDVIMGVSDYWICAPHVPDSMRLNGDIQKAILYCAFTMIAARDVMYDSGRSATCVSDKFKIGFGVGDVGASLICYNSRGTDEGELLTTTDLALQTSAIIGLSPGNNFFNREHGIAYVLEPLKICGYIWDSFMTTQKAYLNAVVRGPDGRKYMAVRVQTTPCECTLWMQFF
jgi:hypothetical protein